MREFYCYGIYFAVYDLALRALRGPHEKPNEVALWKAGFSGALAGFSYWFFGYPVDIVKTRLQADSFENPKYRNALDCVRQLLRTEGPKAFTKGMLPCVARSLPANSLGFITYEKLVSYLKKNVH